ncbi:MAG: CRISPR-associated helicase Cas3' [Clostridiales bacterium]|nr:CRISPR-associated helicase Cas3' [Clostridiales bacterium]
MLWLPLTQHLTDSAGIAKKLWNRWLSPGAQKAIETGLSAPEEACALLVFLAAAHDIGKATPVFQAKHAFPPNELDQWISENLSYAGLPMKPYEEFLGRERTPHALATYQLLVRDGCHRNVAVILGAHHGKPPDKITVMDCTIQAYADHYHMEEAGRETWTAAQRELIAFALDLAGFASLSELPVPSMTAQVLLSGLVVMADWIASNERYFPYFRPEDTLAECSDAQRLSIAWDRLDLPPSSWIPAGYTPDFPFYKERFGFAAPNAMQADVLDVVENICQPGLLILEAPMGMGKTEAALAAAEMFAAASGRTGVFFALPTQATSNAIFPRLLDWTKGLDCGGRYSVNLAHGKAQFNDDFRHLFEGGVNVGGEEEDAAVVQWFEGSKKSLLADFVVGTVDQLLMAALRQKHVMLRHLGLGNKVVIIDECHAYDAYMSSYLAMALRWLGAYRVPVIVLSATLPTEKRRMLMEAYLDRQFLHKISGDLLAQAQNTMPSVPEWVDNQGYPVITWSDGEKVGQHVVSDGGPQREVSIQYIEESVLGERLQELLSRGGCAGVMVNTVRRAQDKAEELRAIFGKEAVTLVHAQFLTPERAEAEKELLQHLGKHSGNEWRVVPHIVVGTQVIEQSLDIDFDVLITDLCPMDLLLQRIGRLHRHTRKRPPRLHTATCHVLGALEEEFQKGSEAVYGRYLLMRARALLPDSMIMPRDIPTLVQAAYNERVPLPIQPEAYGEALEEYHRMVADKESRASTFRVDAPSASPRVGMVGWLDASVSASEKQGEATVRDADASIEVLVIRQRQDGSLCFLPWAEGGQELSAGEAPDPKTAKALARQSLRLPRLLCGPWVIRQTIEELERINGTLLPRWQDSPWLKGQLFLILDEDFQAWLCGVRLTYRSETGLTCEKED